MSLARYFGCAQARRRNVAMRRVPPPTFAAASPPTMPVSQQKDIADIVVDQEMIDFSKNSHAWSVDNQIKIPDPSLKNPNVISAIKACGV